MTDLIAKLESAPGNDTAIFEQIGRWAERNIEEFSLFRWHQLCAVEAFTEAALTLVPEGWLWVGIVPNSITAPGIAGCYSITLEPYIRENGQVDGFGKTTALALSAAALKAHEAKRGGQA